MTGASKRFRNPDEFPYEAFVQRATEAYFAAQGFQIDEGGYSDLVCHSTELGQRWIIEAKGQTSQVGLDFRTGLGQLLQSMHDPSAVYGLAVPNIQSFVTQCSKVSVWTRQAVRLHWLLVHYDGSIKIINPDDAWPHDL